MGRKSIFIVIFFIMCRITCFAQKGDYIIAFWVKAYIETKTDSVWRSQTFSKEWKKLNSNSINNPVQKSELEQIINKLPTEPIGGKSNENIQEKTKDFYHEIKEKKDKTNIDELIDLPQKYKEWPPLKYKKLAQELKNELSNIDVDTTNIVTSIQNHNDKKPEKIDKSEKSTKTSKPSSWWWFWALLGGGIGIFCWERWLREKFLKNEDKNNQDYIEQLQNAKKKLQEEKKEIVQKNKTLEQENGGLREEIKVLKQQSKKVFEKLNKNQDVSKDIVSEIEQHTTIINQNTHTIENTSTLYANSIVNGVFKGISNNLTEDTVFVLNLQTQTKATFTIHTEKYSRVIRRPEFLKGCNTQTVDGGQNLRIVKIGEAKFDQTDGEWKISSELNVTIS